MLAQICILCFFSLVDVFTLAFCAALLLHTLFYTLVHVVTAVFFVFVIFKLETEVVILVNIILHLLTVLFLTLKQLHKFCPFVLKSCDYCCTFIRTLFNLITYLLTPSTPSRFFIYGSQFIKQPLVVCLQSPTYK
jgi:hypothetical protein